MNLITKMSAVLFLGLSLLAGELFARVSTTEFRGPESIRPTARGPDLTAVACFAENSPLRLFLQDPDAKKKKEIEKRYKIISDEYSRLVDEGVELYRKLLKLKPGSASYKQTRDQLKKVDTRKAKIFDEKNRLEKHLFPCGVGDERRYQSKFLLNVINESNLRATVYGTDEEYGIFYGNVAPKSEADFRLAIDAIQRDSGVLVFPAKIVVTYPDGATIPATAGTKTTIRRNFRLVYPTKPPCITHYTLLLTDSDFGLSQEIPEQTGYSIYMDRVSYNPRTINGGPRNDLTVYFTGKPKWPVTAFLYATDCPPGVSCPPQKMTFTESSIKGYNAVVMPKILYCYGFRRSASLGAEVKLLDSAGNETLPAAITTQCIVQ